MSYLIMAALVPLLAIELLVGFVYVCVLLVAFGCDWVHGKLCDWIEALR